MNWRMEKMCDDCPFQNKGAGRMLRDSLMPGRWRSILASIKRGEWFQCHKTTDYDDDGENVITKKTRVCAGALEWINKRGIYPQYQQVFERLAAMQKKGELKTP
jgi:hypothetical protein